MMRLNTSEKCCFWCPSCVPQLLLFRVFFSLKKRRFPHTETLLTVIVYLNFDFVLLQVCSKNVLWEINNNQKVSDSFVCYFVHFQKGQETSGKNNCFGNHFEEEYNQLWLIHSSFLNLRRLLTSPSPSPQEFLLLNLV